MAWIKLESSPHWPSLELRLERASSAAVGAQAIEAARGPFPVFPGANYDALYSVAGSLGLRCDDRVVTFRESDDRETLLNFFRAACGLIPALGQAIEEARPGDRAPLFKDMARANATRMSGVWVQIPEPFELLQVRARTLDDPQVAHLLEAYEAEQRKRFCPSGEPMPGHAVLALSKYRASLMVCAAKGRIERVPSSIMDWAMEHGYSCTQSGGKKPESWWHMTEYERTAFTNVAGHDAARRLMDKGDPNERKTLTDTIVFGGAESDIRQAFSMLFGVFPRLQTLVIHASRRVENTPDDEILTKQFEWHALVSQLEAARAALGDASAPGAPYRSRAASAAEQCRRVEMLIRRKAQVTESYRSDAQSALEVAHALEAKHREHKERARSSPVAMARFAGLRS